MSKMPAQTCASDAAPPSDFVDALRYHYMAAYMRGPTIQFESFTKEKPMKLPSLKTAAANYKKAVKNAAKAREAGRKAQENATATTLANEKAQGDEATAKRILLQVAGK